MFFCFKQKTAYEMRSSDWSSDVFSSDLLAMLVEPERSERVDFGVFSEVRELDQLAVGVATALRRNGFTCNLNVFGSPKKRYSKMAFDYNNFLVRVTLGDGKPLIKVRPNAKYPYARLDESLVSDMLSQMAECEIDMRSEENTSELQ